MSACQVCGKPNAPFGYGPPAHQETFWRCGPHRVEGPVAPAPRNMLELETSDLIARLVDAKIEADWPLVPSDSGTCAHCRRKDDRLIPMGVRRHVWVHPHCWEAWRASLRDRARTALGFASDRNVGTECL